MASNTDLIAAMAFAFQHRKVVAEPGGTMASAAMLSGQFDIEVQMVSAVVSSGNADTAAFACALGL